MIATLSAAILLLAPPQQRGFLARDGQYYPSVDERVIAGQVADLEKLPRGLRWPEIKKMIPVVERLSGSPFKVEQARRLMYFADSDQADRETFQAIADVVALAVKQNGKGGLDPLANGSPEKWLNDLFHYEDVKVDLDTPGYRAADAMFERRKKRRAELQFSLPDLDGKVWSLSGLKGRYVIVDFWGIWCAPCRAELPKLDKLQKRFKLEDLTVVSLAGDDNPDNLRKYLADHPMGFPTLWDKNLNIFNGFEISSFPHLLLFNREGKLVAETNRELTSAELVEMVEKSGLPVPSSN